MSKAVVSLLRSGMVEETAAPEATGGRPATRLRLARDRAQVLGVVIDADRCVVVSAGLDGQLHDDPREFDTPNNYARLLDALTRHAGSLLRDGVSTLGVGVSLPGLVDYREQRGVLSPNVPVTNGQTPSLDLSKRLGVECVLLQESHALCMGEQLYGEAQGLNNFAMLDVHTGVGLGVVAGGRLMTGHSGLAGEIGHITVMPDGRKCGCGNVGCLETVVSDSSLAWRVSRRLRRDISIDEVINLSRSGADDLSAELDEVCRYLAVAYAAIINLFNPSRLIVHGRMFEADSGLFARAIQQARRRSLAPSFADCQIVRASGQKYQGAVAGVVQHLTNAIAPALETRR